MTPLLVQTLSGVPNSRVPVWFMRQAGRYLPEYRALRTKHSMLEAICNPEIAAEITLQPLERFPLDAAIIFADILNPLIGLGITLDFVESVGPVLGNTPKSLADVQKMVVPPAEENVGYTLSALRLVKHSLVGRGVALIGFSGAPFTLAYYLLEGQGGKGGHQCKRYLFSEPAMWSLLMEKLTDLVSDYLIAQAEAGAEILQLFDSWLGLLSRHQFSLHVLPWLKELTGRVREKTSVPLIYFAPYASHLLEDYKELATCGVSAFGVDWKSSLTETSQITGNLPLQGNLDPDMLFAPQSVLEKEVHRIIDDAKGVPNWCFNVGHGLLPQTPIESIERVVSLVKSLNRS